MNVLLKAVLRRVRKIEAHLLAREDGHALRDAVELRIWVARQVNETEEGEVH